MQVYTINGNKEFKIYDGLFTVESPKGGHVTFKIATINAGDDMESSKFDRDNDGKQVVSILKGKDNSWSSLDYKGMGFVGPVLKEGKGWKTASPENLKSISVLFALANVHFNQNPLGQKLVELGYKLHESRKCCRCGRALTTIESILSGIGPVCAKM